jgi:DEAD/DEAH box helicase domain-containing protein
VDRDLEVAISQFAPGGETVKDKRILTSVGVINYERERGRIVPRDGRGAEFTVGVCDDCRALIPEEIIQNELECPICTAQPARIRHLPCWEPLGFTTEPGGDRDFDGQFEFTPFATSARLESRGDEEYQPVPGANIRIAPRTGRTLVINDNEQQLFEFRQLSNSPIQIGIDRNRFAGDYRNQNLGPAVSIALAASKHTDVLLLRLEDIPPNVNLTSVGPHAVYARAAFLSFGSLIRKAACSFLDVQPSELRIGVRATTREGQLPTFELYLMDSLENGAGYCRHLAENYRIMEEVLRPLHSRQLIASSILDDDHASQCDAS